MREIKFRGLMKNKKQWVYGDLVNKYHDFNNQYSIFQFNGGCVKVKQNTIGQYTGLKDKNGKEIYEGDVVIHEFEDYLTKKTKKSYYLIEFKDCSFYLVFQETNDYGVFEKVYDDVLEEYYIKNWKLEVIGNIYENPELLEVI